MSGFYLMARGWLDHPALGGGREAYCRRAAWVWLIEAARYQDGSIGIAGKTVLLKRGQLTHSTRFLASAWGWSEAGVRRFLDRLKTDALIDAATDAGQTIITICNYERYQAKPDSADAASDASSGAAATQDRRSSDANKNKGKEGNQGKETEAIASVGAVAPAKAVRATRLPPDWQPGEREWSWAAENGLTGPQIDEQADRFRDYWIQKPGQKGVSLDWFAAWRTWIRNALKFAQQSARPAPAGRASPGRQGAMA